MYFLRLDIYWRWVKVRVSIFQKTFAKANTSGVTQIFLNKQLNVALVILSECVYIDHGLNKMRSSNWLERIQTGSEWFSLNSDSFQYLVADFTWRFGICSIVLNYFHHLILLFMFFFGLFWYFLGCQTFSTGKVDFSFHQQIYFASSCITNFLRFYFFSGKFYFQVISAPSCISHGENKETTDPSRTIAKKKLDLISFQIYVVFFMIL